MPTLKENLQTNKIQILYFVGVFIVIIANSIVDNILPIIPNSWWGYILADLVSYGLIFFTIIARYVFGNDAKLAQVKVERTANGKEVERLAIENEALRVTNKLANDLLAEKGLKQIIYTPSTYLDLKKLPDPPSKLEVTK